MKKFTLLFTIIFGFNQLMVAQDSFLDTLYTFAAPAAQFVKNWGTTIVTGCLAGYCWHLNKKVNDLQNQMDTQKQAINNLQAKVDTQTTSNEPLYSIVDTLTKTVDKKSKQCRHEHVKIAGFIFDLKQSINEIKRKKHTCSHQEQNRQIQQLKTSQNTQSQTIKKLMLQQQKQISIFSFMTLDMLEKNERSQRDAQQQAIELIERFRINTNDNVVFLDAKKLKKIKEKAYQARMNSVQESLRQAEQQVIEVRDRLVARKGKNNENN